MKTIRIPPKKEQVYKLKKKLVSKTNPEKEFITAEELLERVIPRVEALFDKK